MVFKQINKGGRLMGAVKQALMEVEDLVCGCLQQHRTLNQTIGDLKKNL